MPAPFSPLYTKRRCQLLVTLKLQFRGALGLSRDKALTLRLPPELCRWLGQCWFGDVGRENPPQPPPAACGISGNGSAPPPGASGQKAGIHSLSCLLHDLHMGRSGERRGWHGPASASADPQLLTHSSEVPPGQSSHPKGEEGEKCKAMAKSPPWPRANSWVSHSGHGGWEGELGKERI